MPDTWGELRIIERLCTGTSSSIYRARDTVLDRDIALQMFATSDDSEQQRLLDEGRAMAGIRHPNIVQVLGVDEHDGIVGLKMELIEGQSLHTVLAQQGPVDIAATAVIGGQLCAALAAIYHAGLPHRAIDLNNVLREPLRRSWAEGPNRAHRPISMHSARCSLGCRPASSRRETMRNSRSNCASASTRPSRTIPGIVTQPPGISRKPWHAQPAPPRAARGASPELRSS